MRFLDILPSPLSWIFYLNWSQFLLFWLTIYTSKTRKIYQFLLQIKLVRESWNLILAKSIRKIKRSFQIILIGLKCFNFSFQAIFKILEYTEYPSLLQFRENLDIRVIHITIFSTLNVIWTLIGGCVSLRDAKKGNSKYRFLVKTI